MTAIAKLKRELDKVWESNNLLAYAIPCTQPLMEILGCQWLKDNPEKRR
ncbi:MAG: hypothetical protein PHS04_11125 [Tissierellia bacterium]|nr:hypothetical protein [Tissierellia bacterium]